MTRSEQERLAVVETDLAHLRREVASMDAKVTAMHDLLMQAKGARWAIVSVAALAGFLASKLGALVALFPFPKS